MPLRIDGEREPADARIRLRPMFLLPLVDLDEAAALLGIRTWHPDDDADLELLAELLARRTAIAAAPPPGPQLDARRARQLVDRIRTWEGRGSDAGT